MNRLGCMLTVTALLMGLTSCEERFSESVPAAGEGNPVEVSLSFGFAEEGGWIRAFGARRYACRRGWRGRSVQRTPAACGEDPTGEVTRPDALYQFHLMQYNQSGNLMGSVQYKETVPIGANFSTAPTSLTLQQATDCQLVVIVRGQVNTTPAISGNLPMCRNR